MISLGRRSAVQAAAVLVIAVGAGAAIAGGGDAPANDVLITSGATTTTITFNPATTVSVVATPSSEQSVASVAPGTAIVRIAIIGDEWTGGVPGVGGEGVNSWAGIVEQTIRDGGSATEFGVATVTGGGYARAGEGGLTFADLVTDAILPSTQSVIVFGSRNDLGSSQDAIAEGARAAFQQIRNMLPAVPFYVVAPLRLPADDPADLADIDEILQIVAAEYEATFVDPNQQDWLDTTNPAFIAGDTPTDLGHVAIAQQVCQLVTCGTG